MEHKRTGGMLPMPKDERDIKLGAAFTLPPLSEIPKTFKNEIPETWIFDQLDTDTCAGHATALASSLQEGVLLDPLFTWVMARAMKGMSPDDWGIDLRSVMLAHVKVGALERNEAPYKITDPATVWRDITNWKVDELLKDSVRHKKGSALFIEPTQGYDMFDTLRAVIWKFRAEKIAAVIGLRWAYGTDPVIDKYLDGGFGHAVVQSTWTEDGMHGTIINSWGTAVGEGGKFFISREIINREVPVYGAGIFRDETPENLKWYIEHGIKLDENSLKRIIKVFIQKTLDLLKRLVTKKSEELGGIPSKWLIPALCWQESDVMPGVKGDNGQAHGILQLWQSYITDAMPGYKAADFLNNVPLSVICFKNYMARYATVKQIGRAVTDQDMARIHNGGPAGWKKAVTLPYWWGVKSKMEKLQNGTAPQWVYDRLKNYKLI